MRDAVALRRSALLSAAVVPVICTCCGVADTGAPVVGAAAGWPAAGVAARVAAGAGAARGAAAGVWRGAAAGAWRGSAAGAEAATVDGTATACAQTPAGHASGIMVARVSGKYRVAARRRGVMAALILPVCAGWRL